MASSWTGACGPSGRTNAAPADGGGGGAAAPGPGAGGADGGGGGGGGGVGGQGDAELREAFIKLSVCDGLELTPYVAFPWRSWPWVRPVASCVSEARDCGAVLGCLGLDASAPCSEDDDWPGSCSDEGVASNCTSRPNGRDLWRKVNCAADPADNRQCSLDFGDAFCHADTCPEGAEFEDDWCVGDVLHECKEGKTVRTDCTASGRRCIDAEPPGFCGTGSGEACDDRHHCDGDAAVYCTRGVEADRYDCGAVAPGLTCVISPENRPECGAPEGAGGCLFGQVGCQGSTARVCASGQWVEFDCGGFLNAGCAVGDSKGEIRCEAPD